MLTPSRPAVKRSVLCIGIHVPRTGVLGFSSVQFMCCEQTFTETRRTRVNFVSFVTDYGYSKAVGSLSVRPSISKISFEPADPCPSSLHVYAGNRKSGLQVKVKDQCKDVVLSWFWSQRLRSTYRIARKSVYLHK